MLTGRIEHGNRLVCILLVYGNNHTHAHIEGVEHITLRNMTGSCNQVENGQHLYRTALNPGADALGQASGDILIEAAAGDLGKCLVTPTKH